MRLSHLHKLSAHPGLVLGDDSTLNVSVFVLVLSAFPTEDLLLVFSDFLLSLFDSVKSYSFWLIVRSKSGVGAEGRSNLTGISNVI